MTFLLLELSQFCVGHHLNNPHKKNVFLIFQSVHHYRISSGIYHHSWGWNN